MRNKPQKPVSQKHWQDCTVQPKKKELKYLGWTVGIMPPLTPPMRRLKKLAREEHIPVLIHVDELTQPLGHSSSGSHQRYKSKERLEWEEDFDCNKKMREWLLDKNIATAKELDQLEKACKAEAKEARLAAWNAYQAPIKKQNKKNFRAPSKIE